MEVKQFRVSGFEFRVSGFELSLVRETKNTKLETFPHMNVEEIRLYCLNKQEVTESFPFDEHTLVFKVANKIFAIVPLERQGKIALKCDPAYAIELREQYDGEIVPAWHLSKKHWNGVQFADSSLSADFVKELIDHSYKLVIKGLKKADRERLENE